VSALAFMKFSKQLEMVPIVKVVLSKKWSLRQEAKVGNFI
jgi:hypothetical protein